LTTFSGVVVFARVLKQYKFSNPFPNKIYRSYQIKDDKFEVEDITRTSNFRVKLISSSISDSLKMNCLEKPKPPLKSVSTQTSNPGLLNGDALHEGKPFR
jgi:hypothetical protein